MSMGRGGEVLPPNVVPLGRERRSPCNRIFRASARRSSAAATCQPARSLELLSRDDPPEFRGDFNLNERQPGARLSHQRNIHVEPPARRSEDRLQDHPAVREERHDEAQHAA